jgi:PAS domain S-box-containing protein
MPTILAAGIALLAWGTLMQGPNRDHGGMGWIQVTALASAALLLIVAAAVSRWPPTRRRETEVLTAVALILVVNLCVETWASQTGLLSDMLGWILIAAGLVIGSVPAVALVVSFALASWGTVTWYTVAPEEWSHYAVSLILAGGVALALAVLRVRVESGEFPDSADTRRELRRAKILAELAQRVPSHRSLVDFLAWATPRLQACLGDVLIEVLEFDSDSQALRLVAGDGWSPSLYGNSSISLESGELPATVYRERASQTVADFRGAPQFLAERYDAVGVRSAACTFIPGAHCPFGTLGACSIRAHEFQDRDLLFLEKVARVLGRATDSYQTESERSWRDQAHHAAQRLTHVGSWSWDVQEDTLEWSDEVLRIFGLSRARFGGTYEAFLGRVHPDDRTMVSTAVSEGLTGGGFGVEYRLIRPEGEVRFVRGFGEVTVGDRGEPLRLIGTLHDVTDERRAEDDRLAEGERRAKDHQLSVFLQSSPDGVLITERSRDISFVNERIETIFGYSASELLGHPIDILLPDGDVRSTHLADEEKYRMAPELRQMASRDGDLWGRRKDGSLVPLKIHLTPIRSGSKQQVMATIRDVSNEKTNEARLREEHQLFQATFDQAAVGIAHISLDREFVRINRKFSEIVGAGADELLGSQYDLLVHPDDLLTDDVVLSELIEGVRETYSLEQRYVRSDGSLLWIEVTVSVGRDDREQPLYLIYVIADITVRKRLQVDLSWEREFLRTIFDNIPVMIVTVMLTSELEPHPPTLRVNEEFRRATGWTETGEALFRACFPTGKIANQFLGKPLSTPPSWEQLELPTMDGVPLSVSWFRLRLSDGTLVGIGMDESERQELEAQLRQSDKMKAIGQLAGGVAHDFNNLLTVIGGRGQLIASDLAPDSEAYQSVQEILKSADMAAGVTQELLSFSRQDVVVLEDLSLNDVYLGMERLLGRLIAADIESVSRLDPALGVVRASRVQLEQVFLNLIVNATDAMKETGGAITVETVSTLLTSDDIPTGATLEAGPYAALVVRDTGCGMPPDRVSRIFEPFFTTKASGTGLGLSTVYGIVEKFGGTIQVTSKEGLGTTFTVLLPEHKPNSERKSESKRSVGEGSLGGSETIILAEDSGELRQLAGDVLADSGYTVLEARNGVDALRIAERLEGRFDLLVTDVVMPKMRGPELHHRMLQLNPDLKTLFISGYARERLADLDTEAPGCLFLPKPFELEDLLESLRELVGRS